MFADRNLSFEELQKTMEANKIALTEEEYLMQNADNALSFEIELNDKESVLKVNDCQQLHAIMCKGIGRDAGIINGNRHLKFFDKNDERDMADGERLVQELKLLDLQTKKLMKLAGNDREEKIKTICFQALRLFAIHPFNDANKRISKTILSHFFHKEFGAGNNATWNNISPKIINQAIRGNNIGPFTRAVCETYGVGFDPHKITETELSTYRIYPDTGTKTYPLRKELKRSRIRQSNKVSSKDPVLCKSELQEMGITATTGLFRKNPIYEDLMASTSTDALLRKTKKYHIEGKISDAQAKALIKKTIQIVDGASERHCDLATKKILSGEISDVKKAVRFYEKDSLKITADLPKKKIYLQIAQTVKDDTKVDQTFRIR